jgi:hypothetical protein
MTNTLTHLTFTLALLLLTGAHAATLEELANKTGKTENKVPTWAKHGALVYRIATPDAANMLPQVEAGMAMTSNLLDGTIRQIPLMNGIIGHDHPGSCNWDGVWPYWNRVTYRAKDWETLHAFMARVKERHNVLVSFHVNLTDVNAGLRDYPETREFFKKLVETHSIYRRDYNPATRRYEIGQPYVPQTIPADATDPNQIIALVNYKNFWESGLAKEMIDGFYAHLPYAPPILYLDVLNLSGGNFSTGFPDGPLGGSMQTQLEGVQAIAAYLHGKGTALATEGDRPREAGKWASYVWLHGNPGYSADDYSTIAGAAKGPRVVVQHVFGNTGCFVTSPIASTTEGLAKVREHYARLLAGKPGIRPMPDTSTWHIADRQDSDEFDIPGTGDPFRGDWIDLVNNFYLTGILELYHIGKGNVRTHVFNKVGVLHLRELTLSNGSGAEIVIPVANCLPAAAPGWLRTRVKAEERLMIESPLTTRVQAPQAGAYRLKMLAANPGRGTGALNVYVNGHLQASSTDVICPPRGEFGEIELGDITLQAGENTLRIDTGPIYAKWSDGTTAVWSTPALGTGFSVTNGDVTFAQDYDRMWPDTWSGGRKIYFYSWDGTSRAWKLPQEWAGDTKAILYPLTPTGRGKGQILAIGDRTVTPRLLPQVPYLLEGEKRSR